MFPISQANQKSQNYQIAQFFQTNQTCQINQRCQKYQVSQLVIYLILKDMKMVHLEPNVL
ncbi:MAG: helix-turn-helix domain-containing protein [Niameybacter sp.]|nr:helix-turn-helix domain-containing protein [Niameybacter sp.]